MPIYFFHSKNISFSNSICRYLMFLNVYFSCQSTIFTSWYLALHFFTEAVLHSLTPYEKTLLFVVFTFFKVWCHVYHFHRQNISFYYSNGRNLRVLHVFFFRACIPFSPVKNFSFCEIREISRQA